MAYGYRMHYENNDTVVVTVTRDTAILMANALGIINPDTEIAGSLAQALAADLKHMATRRKVQS